MFCRNFGNAKATCLRILQDKSDLKKFHLWSVSPVLLVSQKSEIMPYSKFLLAGLMEHNRADSERVITGDDIWLFPHYLLPHSGRHRVMTLLIESNKRLT
jgi:hypothetical protein